MDLSQVVTAFTVAHSVTLGAGVLGWVVLPGRLVESFIAVSVILAALNNLRPFLPWPRWRLAFAFGLIHGLGFAAVLGELGLPPGGRMVALAAFNLGVELGQLALVVVAFPLAYAFRRGRPYQVWVLRGGSVAATLVACVWLLERSLGLDWATS